MDDFFNQYGFTRQQWEHCLKVLETLKDDPLVNPDNQHFGALITKIHKAAKKKLKQPATEQRKNTHLQTIQQTDIVKQAQANQTRYEDSPGGSTPTLSQLQKPHRCYVCNESYEWMHSVYHRLCPSCAELNYKKRFETIDLAGRRVILTGGRVKIGFATALKLLRSNAHLTVTTRFPALALEQFQQQADYETWQHRLEVYGLDLRNLKAVQAFIDYYSQQHGQLDVLINNAAQTIRYDTPYYTPLIVKEHQLLDQLTSNSDAPPKLFANNTPVTAQAQALLADYQTSEFVPNRFGQPVDNRTKNSWNSTLSEVPLPEVLEVNLINHISPYMLIKGFTPLLRASAFAERFIINVTSSEGQFSYGNKTMFHPHTNMTKAALNMLTRTSAQEYAQYQIFMNAVDVGWVSTGAIEPLRQKQFAQGQVPPLDSVDGAARIMHPMIETLQHQRRLFGHLLKNYEIVDW